MKKLILLVCSILIGYSSPILSMGLPQMGGGGGFDPQQMQQMEQQLMQEIDQYVNSLSPEEQAEFHKAVEEETKKIEQMSPDDLEQYIQDTFAGTGADAAQLPDTKKDDAKKEEVKEVKVEDTAKQKDTVSLINSLSKHLETYIRKLNASPETSAKLPKWARQGRIVGWKNGATFNDYKKDLEILNQRLKKIIKRDDKTKKYIFLSDITANEALINNMSKLKSSLDHWEPQIVLKALDFETLSASSKKALIQATNALLEGLYVLAIPKALDDVIVKYDPEAKKLREATEKQEKQALEESKRGPRQTATKSVGSEPAGRGGGYRNYDPYGGSGYQGGGYDPYSGYGSYDYGNYGQSGGSPAYGAQSPQASPGYTSSGGGRSSTGPRSSTATNTKLSNLPAGKKEQKATKEDKGKKDIVKPVELSNQEQRRIDTFGLNIENALNKLEAADLLKPYDTITKAGKIDTENQIIQVNKNIQTARRALDVLDEAIDTMHSLAKNTTLQQKQTYANALNNEVQQHKKKLSDLLGQIKKLHSNEQSLSKNARYAYLGSKEDDSDKLSDKEKENFKETFDIYKVNTLLQEINKGINLLNAGKNLPTRKKN